MDEEFIKYLNLNYARALIYEFSLNNRDAIFLNKVSEVSFYYFRYHLLKLIFFCYSEVIGMIYHLKKKFIASNGKNYIC